MLRRRAQQRSENSLLGQPTTTGDPRFITYLGTEAPKLTDLQDGVKADAATLPLHAKPKAVRTFRHDEFKALSGSVEKKTAAAEVLPWLFDRSRYDALLARFLRRHAAGEARGLLSGRCSLSRQDLEMFVAIRKFDIIERLELVCTSNIFAVVEILKARRRPISESLLNDLFEPSDMPALHLPTKAEIRKNMHEFGFFCQLDASAYYDQFQLAREVANLFGILHGATAYRQRTLPMGFRPSCLIAQRVTDVLLDLQIPGVVCLGYIDNFLFWSNSASLLRHAVSVFLARCDSCGILINDPDDRVIHSSSPTPDCICEAFDCLGERYDLRHRSRTVTEATRDKLRAAATVIREQAFQLTSVRRLAAVYGILFFASNTFGTALSPKRYFDSVYFLRQLSRVGQTAGWASTAPRLPVHAYDQTVSWLIDAMSVRPVPMVTPETEADLVVTVDACALGWGAVIEVPSSGAHRTVALPWSADDARRLHLWSSVVTEPTAALRAAMTAITPDTRHIHIITDHSALVSASRRGWAAGRSYNDVLCRFAELWPNITVSFSHIAGAKNRADPLSRGQMGWSSAQPSTCVTFPELPSVRVGRG